MSWVHLDDLVELIMTALRKRGYKGVYNATAPNPVRMSELCESLGSAMGRPSWLPVPDFALQVLVSCATSVTAWRRTHYMCATALHVLKVQPSICWIASTNSGA